MLPNTIHESNIVQATDLIVNQDEDVQEGIKEGVKLSYLFIVVVRHVYRFLFVYM